MVSVLLPSNSSWIGLGLIVDIWANLVENVAIGSQSHLVQLAGMPGDRGLAIARLVFDIQPPSIPWLLCDSFSLMGKHFPQPHIFPYQEDNDFVDQTFPPSIFEIPEFSDLFLMVIRRVVSPQCSVRRNPGWIPYRYISLLAACMLYNLKQSMPSLFDREHHSPFAILLAQLVYHSRKESIQLVWHFLDKFNNRGGLWPFKRSLLTERATRITRERHSLPKLR